MLSFPVANGKVCFTVAPKYCRAEGDCEWSSSFEFLAAIEGARSGDG